MADTLATLIRLAEQKVEKVQIELAAVQRKLAEVHAAQQSWNAELTRANSVAMEGIAHSEAEGLQQAELFARRVAHELARLAKVETEIKTEADRLTAVLNTHFAEQKRYEILHERQQMAEKKKHAKKAQDSLDETAGHKHTRKE